MLATLIHSKISTPRPTVVINTLLSIPFLAKASTIASATSPLLSNAHTAIIAGPAPLIATPVAPAQRALSQTSKYPWINRTIFHSIYGIIVLW